jgi:hypothetical protein
MRGGAKGKKVGRTGGEEMEYFPSIKGKGGDGKYSGI